jgi:multiple antibiotic resistance protein
MPWIEIIAPYFMTLLSLLFIVNPLNGAVLFIDLTEGASDRSKRKTALSTAIATFFILMIFSLAGKLIFNFFGFTLAAFQVAGGIIIFSTARGMTQAKTPREKHTPEEAESAMSLADVSIVPLAIPILAGPGAITAVLLTMGDMKSFFVEFPIHLLSLLITSTVIYYVLVHSERVFRRLGRNVINVLTRIMGMVMMAIGVQYVLNGLTRYFQQVF